MLHLVSAQVFVHKQETLEATPERLATFERFRNDLQVMLRGEDTKLG